ncbi:MAG: ABC transporter permease [Actinomycetota bacterium]|nr:ABC transporter permease [Acidimicrobiia bacterium]MDQ3468886.1 ABC transporter permease [Actinomycetota bacterium]
MSTPTSVRGQVARWGLNVYAGIGLVYLFVPIGWIVWFSFNQPAGRYNIVWQRFTLDNWSDPFRNRELTDAFVQSLKIAGISTAIATVLGSLIAVALSRYSFRGASGFNLLLVLPLTTPEIVLGSSLATLYFDWDVSRGFTTVVIAHIMFQVSFVALTVRARVRGFDWTLEQAAQDLGATPLRTFWKITFPLILPGILAAALLSFALSIDDFIITLFTAGSLSTFPLYINGSFRVQFPPQANVLATMILVVSVALLMIGVVRSSRRDAGRR